MKLIDLYQIIKSDLCDLFSYKLYDDALEISTIHGTINNKFVSVFVKINNENEFVVTDAGWIDEGMYGIVSEFQNSEIMEHVQSFYINKYKIAKKEHPYTGIVYYYKVTTLKMLSADVLDMSEFIQGMVNAIHLEYEERKVEEKRKLFNKEVKSYLRKRYDKYVEFGYKIKDVSFNAVIHKNTNNYLLNFVTGSNHTLFNKNISEAAVKFQMVNGEYSKLAIINDETDGYVPNKIKPYLGFIEDKLNVRVIEWTKREQLAELIN